MKLEIFRADTESPRQDSNLGTIFYKSNYIILGDERISGDPIEWLEEQLGVKPEFEYTNRRLKELSDLFCQKFIALPVYKYEHSGIVLATTPFSCPWDSGQVGFIMATPKEVREWYGVSRVTKKVRERALESLRGEIETFSQFLEGEVYGFRIIDEDGDEVDGCSGFYGDNHLENGMLDYIDLSLLGTTDEELKTLLKEIEVTED